MIEPPICLQHREKGEMLKLQIKHSTPKHYDSSDPGTISVIVKIKGMERHISMTEGYPLLQGPKVPQSRQVRDTTRTFMAQG